MDSRTQRIIDNISKKVSLYNYKVDELSKEEEKKKEFELDREEAKKRKEEYDNLNLACKLMLEKLTHKSKYKLETFLTYALQSIFTDRNYEIKLILKEDSKSSGLEISLVESNSEQEITDSVGGGIVSLIGLLLQIYYIEIYGLNKTMIIDEGLRQISTGKLSSKEGKEPINYLENTVNFMSYLSKEKGYKFIIVTHDNFVRSIADRVYEVEKGKVNLVV